MRIVNNSLAIQKYHRNELTTSVKCETHSKITRYCEDCGRARVDASTRLAHATRAAQRGSAARGNLARRHYLAKNIHLTVIVSDVKNAGHRLSPAARTPRTARRAPRATYSATYSGTRAHAHRARSRKRALPTLRYNFLECLHRDVITFLYILILLTNTVSMPDLIVLRLFLILNGNRLSSAQKLCGWIIHISLAKLS